MRLEFRKNQPRAIAFEKTNQRCYLTLPPDLDRAGAAPVTGPPTEEQAANSPRRMLPVRQNQLAGQ